MKCDLCEELVTGSISRHMRSQHSVIVREAPRSKIKPVNLTGRSKAEIVRAFELRNDKHVIVPALKAVKDASAAFVDDYAATLSAMFKGFKPAVI